MTLTEFSNIYFPHDEEAYFVYLRWYFNGCASRNEEPQLSEITNQLILDLFQESMLVVFQKNYNSTISKEAYFRWLKLDYDDSYRRHVSKESYQRMNVILKKTIETQFDATDARKYLEFIKKRFRVLDAFEVISLENIREFKKLQSIKTPSVAVGDSRKNFASGILRGLTVAALQEETLEEDSGVLDITKTQVFLSSAMGMEISSEFSADEETLQSIYDVVQNPNSREAIQLWRKKGNLLKRGAKCLFCSHSFPVESIRASRNFARNRTLFAVSRYDAIPVKLEVGNTVHLDINLFSSGICPKCFVSVAHMQEFNFEKSSSTLLPEYLQPFALKLGIEKLREGLLSNRDEAKIAFGNVFPDDEVNTFSDTPIRTLVANLKILMQNQKEIRNNSTVRFEKLALQNIINAYVQKIIIDLRYLNQIIDNDWLDLREHCLEYVKEGVEESVDIIKDDFRERSEQIKSRDERNRFDKNMKNAVKKEEEFHATVLYLIVVMDFMRDHASQETGRCRERLAGGNKSPWHLKSLLKKVCEERKLLSKLYAGEPRKLIENEELSWIFDL